MSVQYFLNFLCISKTNSFNTSSQFTSSPLSIRKASLTVQTFQYKLAVGYFVPENIFVTCQEKLLKTC